MNAMLMPAGNGAVTAREFANKQLTEDRRQY
jgi:hypothetical protein